MNRFRPRLLVVAMYLGLLALLAVCGLYLSRCREAAIRAAGSLDACRQLADKIEALRAVPAQASLERRDLTELAMKIQQAAQTAKIPDTAIVRISPQPGRRVGESAHVQQPTNVEIRQVSLEQIARFLVELSSSQSGLEASSLRLTAPRTPPEDPQNETWFVELVLTHLVFLPEYAPHST